MSGSGVGVGEDAEAELGFVELDRARGVLAAAAGERFACRLEIYRTDEAKVPDPAQWETEVAIRLADS